MKQGGKTSATKVTTRSMLASKLGAAAGTGRNASGKPEAPGAGTSSKKIISALTAQAGKKSSASTSTLSSTGSKNPGVEKASDRIRSRVAYLEPVAYDLEGPKHPGEVGKLLFDAGFKDTKEITKIGRFRYKLDLKCEDDYERLLRVNLATVNLRVFLPTSLSESVLFVPNVPFDFDDEDMMENIECQHRVLKVERILRMRDGELVKTGNLKITIKGKEVPRSVRIYGCGFKAELYIFPVKQCKKCWRFGHTQTKCRGLVRCGNCGGSHDQGSSACPNPARCINCKKEHGAGDRNCPDRKRNIEINKEMAKRGILFAEAECLVPLAPNRFALLETEADELDQQGTSQNVAASSSTQQSGGRLRSARTFASVTEASFAGQDSDRNGGRKGKTAGEDHAPRNIENPLKATEFEAFVGQLRRIFLQQVQQKGWLQRVIALKDNLNSKLQGKLEGIELDRLLIEVSTELNRIVESTQEIPEPSNSRIVEQNQNVE